MAVLTWPTTLPQVPQKGYSESVGVNVIRTSTDLGPAKQRTRGRRPSELTVSFIMTTAEVAVLESFVHEDTRGSKRFKFKHPRTQAVMDMRIVPNNSELYQLQYLAPGYWTVNMKLEVLP